LTFVSSKVPQFVTRCVVVCIGLAVAGLNVVAGAGVSAQAAREPVTFNRDVAPILYGNCVTCHRPGESAPFSLLTYEDARQRARLIATAVSSHVMPPWQPESAEGEFEGERRLSSRDIATLQQWVADGIQEGGSEEQPAPPVFTPGWRLGTPDIIVTMAEPFTVPADGPDVFRNFVLPIPLGERRFVRALEFRPGNSRVLHHARMLLDDTGDIKRLDDADPAPGFGGMDVPGARFPDGHFLGWAPGKSVSTEAYPWPLEPGNDFVVQMHLKPTGRPETVQASIGLYLTDTPPNQTPVMIRLGSKTIDISPGESSYEVIDRFTLPTDVTALSVYPHAHYLAREMLVLARQPNGHAETMLRIPNWNFNWQDEYTYSQPMKLSRGTTIEMRYRYDNSADNPHNPSSPPQRVRFGSETRDEMGELLVQVLPTSPAGYAGLREQITRKNLLTDVAGEEKRVADFPDDAETRNALGVLYVRLGRIPEALAQIQASLRTDPELARAHYNLGVIAMTERRVDEAIARFQRALASRPEYAEAHNNLGIAYETSGRTAEAEAEYRAALRWRPSHSAAHNNLGRLLLARGAVPEATAEFRAALRTQPDNADGLYNLGRALMASGQPRDAVQQWRRAVAARPDSSVFALDLAWVLATNRDVLNPRDAIKLAENVNRAAKGNNASALDVLAAAYAADGRIELAARTAQLALQRALSAKNTALAAEIRQRLSAYQEAAQGGSEERAWGSADRQ
jgi:tetratricopeptide (TPR) repeat protein